MLRHLTAATFALGLLTTCDTRPDLTNHVMPGYYDRDLTPSEYADLVATLVDERREWRPCVRETLNCYREVRSGHWIMIQIEGTAMVGHRSWRRDEAASVSSTGPISSTTMYMLVDAVTQHAHEKYVLRR